MATILVSKCLLGEPCRYDGKSCPVECVRALAAHHTLVPVCPEVEGGLSTPRTPAEIVGDRVITRDGRDVSDAYRRGAEAALRLVREHHADFAILKSRSPSCGHGLVYDGSFTGEMRPGDGITASYLAAHGVAVYTELDGVDWPLADIENGGENHD